MGASGATIEGYMNAPLDDVDMKRLAADGVQRAVGLHRDLFDLGKRCVRILSGQKTPIEADLTKVLDGVRAIGKASNAIGGQRLIADPRIPPAQLEQIQAAQDADRPGYGIAAILWTAWSGPSGHAL